MKKTILTIGLMLSTVMIALPQMYAHTCRFTTSSGTEITIAYNGSYCGATNGWASVKVFSDGSALVENSSMYGQFNMSNFPCCRQKIVM